LDILFDPKNKKYNQMKYYHFLLLSFFIIILHACKNDSKPITSEGTGNKVIETPLFDADSAYSYVKAQTDFGPRVPNSESHRQCAAYLAQKMAQFCDTVIVQNFTAITYDNKKLQSQNIIASFSPEKKNRILLASHWDSRHIADHDPDPEKRHFPIDGANDGASGVGVLIEIARQLQHKRADTGIDIIFFDAEDYGTPQSENLPGDWWCLGSQYWANHKHQADYRFLYGILLDMVGAANATFYHEGFSSHYAQPFLSKIWGRAYQLGFGQYFINNPANYITDDHYYINTIAKIPMVNIVHQDKNSNTGFCPYWHTLQDNIHIIDKQTLDAVGKTVLSILYDEK
jgi:Zn-dependent M28 family amino/carboxypeptidase